MNPKPKLHTYIVRLIDGKEIKVKAHNSISTFKIPGPDFLVFQKNNIDIVVFREWSYWRLLK